MRFLSLFAALCLATAPVNAEPGQGRTRVLLVEYIAKVQNRSERYVVLIADDLLLETGGCPGFYRHFGVDLAAARAVEVPRGCLLEIGAIATLVAGPFLFLGAQYAPYVTTAVGTAIPLSAALIYFLKKPYFSEYLSERHYRKVREWSGQFRRELPGVWTEETFMLFHETMRELILNRSGRLQAWLQSHGPGSQVTEEERRELYISYLELWTLGALYDIEMRRFFRNSLSPEKVAEVQKRLEELLASVTDCQRSLLQINRTNPAS